MKGTKHLADWEADEHLLDWLSMCKALGMTDKCLAKAMNIGFGTYCEWKLKSEPFRAALAKGRIGLANDIAGEMAKRAVGYTYDEIKTVVKGDMVKGGKTVENRQLVEQTKVTKHVAADVGAGIFLLTNLRPDKFKNYQRIDGSIETTNKLKGDQIDALVKQLNEPDADEK